MAEGEKKPGSAGRGQGSLGQLVKVESFLQMAITLPAAVVIGWLLGSAVDKHFHTKWVGVLGIVLGAVAGFIQIITMAVRFMKSNE